MRGELTWGIRKSLLEYIELLPDGSVSISGGAQGVPSGPFTFPSEEIPYESLSGTGEMKFFGLVVVQGHGGHLSVTLENPWIEISHSEARLSAILTDTREALVEFTLGSSIRQADTYEWRDCPTYLTRAGAKWLGGQYGEGEEMEPITIVMTGL